MLLRHFNEYESEAKRLIEAGLVLPAYEMVLKCSHTFNLLDARGAISVTERAAYIGRVRALARLVAQAYYASREALGFPMCKREAAAGMSDADTLLVELLTEELPPKALARLGQAFADALQGRLARDGFLERRQRDALVRDAAPARGADRRSVRDAAPDRPVEVAGAVGQSRPRRGRASRRRRCSASRARTASPSKRSSSATRPKGRVFFYRAIDARRRARRRARVESRGRAEGAADSQGHALGQRATPSSCGPVHGLVMLHGARVVPARCSASRAATRRSAIGS